MFRKIIFLHITVTFIGLFANSAYSQFSTPSLDPMIEVYLPAATSWKYIKGENDADDTRTATVAARFYGGSGKGENISLKEWKFSRNGYLLIAKAENVNIEALYEKGQKTNSYSSGRELKINNTFLQVGFGLLMRKLSVGAMYRSNDDEYPYSSNDSYIATKIKQTGNSASVTMQLGRAFFLAAGAEANVLTSDDYAGNSWTDYSYAMSVMMGNPDETLLRAEYASTRSPEAYASASGKYNSEHQGNTATNITAEVKMGDIIIGFRQGTIEYNEGTKFYAPKSEYKATQYGGGKIKSNGFVWGLYLVSIEEIKGNIKLRTNSSKIHIGYNF